MITDKQRRTIYGLGNKCGLYQRGNKRDGLHDFIYQLTLKPSIAKLTEAEAERVIQHLRDNERFIEEKALQQKKTVATIEERQIKKIFGLMYELSALDDEPTKATVKQRIAGVILKLFGLKVNLCNDIFKDITFKQGEAIIEEIKRYVCNAKRRKKRRTS